MFLSSALITVHLENLRHNLKTLLARHPLLMPVIKADAYGHGIVAVARVLAEEGGTRIWRSEIECGEGALLRQDGHTAFLLALAGARAGRGYGHRRANYDITPLVHNRESLQRILDCKSSSRRAALPP